MLMNNDWECAGGAHRNSRAFTRIVGHGRRSAVGVAGVDVDVGGHRFAAARAPCDGVAGVVGHQPPVDRQRRRPRRRRS